jgi:hypothetical protein
VTDQDRRPSLARADERRLVHPDVSTGTKPPEMILFRAGMGPLTIDVAAADAA